MLEVMNDLDVDVVYKLFEECGQKPKEFLNDRYKNYVSYAINGEALSNITTSEAIVHVAGLDLRANVIKNAISKDSLDLAESFKGVFDISAHKELLTVAPNSFEAYFKEYVKISKLAAYHFERHDFPYKLVGDIRHDIKKEELLALYKRFGKHFKTYIKRDLSSFEDLKNVSGLYQNDRLLAYMIYQIKIDEVVIEELIYEDLKSLLVMISYALSLKSNVELKLSSSENIGRYLKTAPSLSDDLIVTINDLELYNRLFKIEAKTIKEAIDKTFKGPIYMRSYLL